MGESESAPTGLVDFRVQGNPAANQNAVLVSLKRFRARTVSGRSPRVSIRGTTSASQDDLPGLFSAQPDEEVDFDEMAFEGGWTRALFLSATAALLSAPP